MKKWLFLVLLSCVFLKILLAQNSAESLLSGFLENDVTLKKNVLTMQSKSVALDSTRLSNGIGVELSTGTVKITTNASKTKVKFEPVATVSVPQFFDSEFSADIPIVIEDGEKTVTDGVFSVGVGIASAAGKKRKAEVLEAQKAFDDALRAVKNRAVQQEDAFYTELKSLYKSAVSVLTKCSDRYDDVQSLNVLSAKDYRTDSAAFQNASLKVSEDDFAIEEAIRTLAGEVALFAKKCGVSVDFSADGTDALSLFARIVAFLPAEIPEVDTVEIKEFDGETYAELLDAQKTHEINDLKREGETAMTLRASAIYTLNDSFSKSDSAGGKITWKWNGVSLGAGVFMPTGTNLVGEPVGNYNENPYFTLSAAFSLSDILLAKKTREQNALKSQIELLAIEDARLSYEEDCVSKTSRLNTILWNENAYAQKFALYSANAEKSRGLFERGLAKEIDFQQAQHNAEKARLTILVNKIDKILCVNETKLLFNEGK